MSQAGGRSELWGSRSAWEGSHSPRTGMGMRTEDPCRPGPGLVSPVEKSGAEARRISARERWRLGAQYAQLLGPAQAPAQKQAPLLCQATRPQPYPPEP